MCLVITITYIQTHPLICLELHPPLISPNAYSPYPYMLPDDAGKLRHCMYGLDADLIMLSLVTHEPFFVLLREKISKRKQNTDAMSYSPEDFELLEISLLRKMLNQHFRRLEMEMNAAHARLTIAAQEIEAQGGVAPPVPPRFELERVIDDFVFMCFFVGNDFLPCIPHLDIADGSLNLMMNVYRDLLPALGGYLTQKASIHLPRTELFLQEIGRREPLYFQQRATDEKGAPPLHSFLLLPFTPPVYTTYSIPLLHPLTLFLSPSPHPLTPFLFTFLPFSFLLLVHRPVRQKDPKYADDNYSEHYYKTKFGFESTDVAAKDRLVRSYLEGLSWVLTYYHMGCGSWTW